MARHAVAVAFTVLIHALLGLVSAMPGPAAPSRPGSAGARRLQCPHCFRAFTTHANFRNHQAAMANRAGTKGCGRDVPHPISSGWAGGGPRAAGTVADLSGQREAGRLRGIYDSDSDSSGRGGHRQVDQHGGGQEAGPAVPDSDEEAGRAVPDSPAGDGGAEQVYTCIYLHIHANKYVYLHILTKTCRYIQIPCIPTNIYKYPWIPAYTYMGQTWNASHSVTYRALPVSVLQYLLSDTRA